jgi:hypothetical protein
MGRFISLSRGFAYGEITTETLGISAEKTICDMCGLDSSRIGHRSNKDIEEQLAPLLKEAIAELPKIEKYVGDKKGDRGGQSKSPVDFVSSSGETISVKTTWGGEKVCPSECGQPGGETFDRYFGHIYEGHISYEKAKKLVLTQFHEMIPIYLEHLFDNDYLLFIKVTRQEMSYLIVKKQSICKRVWDRTLFSFSQTLGSWKESCTIKYRGITIGEFQLHQHRNNYKFRFNFDNLISIIYGDE